MYNLKCLRKVMEFKRPESVSYPQIYSTFKAIVKDSNEVEEFIVQDLTEEFFDRAVEFIVENHARGAVFHKAANTLIGESGFKKVGESYRNGLKEKVSLICLKKETNEIAGLNVLVVKAKDQIMKVEVSWTRLFKYNLKVQLGFY